MLLNQVSVPSHQLFLFVPEKEEKDQYNNLKCRQWVKELFVKTLKVLDKYYISYLRASIASATAVPFITIWSWHPSWTLITVKIKRKFIVKTLYHLHVIARECTGFHILPNYTYACMHVCMHEYVHVYTCPITWFSLGMNSVMQSTGKEKGMLNCGKLYS